MFDSYLRHLETTADWLARSIRPDGGSSAYYAPIIGWSDPYPETTGYLIPTLVRIADYLEQPRYHDLAVQQGQWLLDIQLENGAWQGGLYKPGRVGKPSVFNSGQILKGMLALFRTTGEDRWLRAADRGAEWLASGIGADGYWQFNDYRSERTPTYYTHVAWPMLAIAKETNSDRVSAAALAFLKTVLDRQLEAGDFQDWSFAPDKPAFTHTIAYTIRGLQESAALVDPTDLASLRDACLPALEKLRQHAEIYNGRLPGAYSPGWKKDNSYTCLTGNAQTALCLLIWEQQLNDLRIVNSAAKLVDNVCASQKLAGSDGRCGAVAGSQPLWKPYLRFRYPNWAAKYHCDALMKLVDRLQRETGESAIPTRVDVCG